MYYKTNSTGIYLLTTATNIISLFILSLSSNHFLEHTEKVLLRFFFCFSEWMCLCVCVFLQRVVLHKQRANSHHDDLHVSPPVANNNSFVIKQFGEREGRRESIARESDVVNGEECCGCFGLQPVLATVEALPVCERNKERLLVLLSSGEHCCCC